MAIGTLPVQETDLDYVTLSDEPIVLAVPREHPIARRYDLAGNTPMTPYYLPPEELNGQDLITLVREQGMGRVAYQILRRHNIHPNIVMTLKNNTTALRMASAGLGMVFALADTAARAELLKPMAWFTLDDPVFCRKTIAYYYASYGLSPWRKSLWTCGRRRWARRVPENTVKPLRVRCGRRWKNDVVTKNGYRTINDSGPGGCLFDDLPSPSGKWPVLLRRTVG